MSAPQLPTPHIVFLFPPQGYGIGGAIVIAPIDVLLVLRSFTYDTTTDTTDSISSTIFVGVETA